MSIAPLIEGVISHTHSEHMPRRPFSDSDLATAANLKRLWKARQAELGLTQEGAAEALGAKTQGLVWQHLEGRTRLTLDHLIGWSRLLRVSPGEIDPRLGDASSVTPAERVHLDLYRRLSAEDRAMVDGMVRRMADPLFPQRLKP